MKLPPMIQIGKDLLNTNELIRGAILGMLLTPATKWAALIVIPAASYLYALSGCKGRDKIWRRIWMPGICGLACAINLAHWPAILGAIPGYGLMTLGYGLPSTQPPDEGSWIGQKIYKYITTDETLATWIMHGSIAFFWLLGYAFFWK